VCAISLNDPACIGVDFVPLLPGGDNGGAKLLSLELVRNLGRIASKWQFVLLASEKGKMKSIVLNPKMYVAFASYKMGHPSLHHPGVPG